MNAGRRGTWLDALERLGNRLPEPATLFLACALAVMLLSWLAAGLGWSLTRPGSAEAVAARSLLDAEGLWWALSNLVENFIRFPPLGIVLVGMLGIGLAERSGLIDALLRRILLAVRGPWLTPATVFLGVMSSLGLDAGYVVLPPIAAALYLAAGRPPLAGIAAVFAGISAGFSANLFITAVDPLLAGFTEAGARLVDPGFRIAVTANWYFMAVSTVLLTLAGWAVTALWVEPRLEAPRRRAPATVPGTVNAAEARGLRAAGLAFGAVLALILALVWIPGAPLHGLGERFPRWIEVTVPLLMLAFLVPGLAYGIAAGSIRSDRDAARMLGETMAGLGPYIVLAFCAAQFIKFFEYSRLGEMLSIAGGQWLVGLALDPRWLVLAFVLVVALGNLVLGSASAKYALFAPVFVPMLMQVGVSPELTQLAYRIGDSATNVITPLNPYMVIIVALVQRYAPGSGLGTVVALMLPYSLAFLLLWSLVLGLWMGAGWQPGPGGALVWP